jgi:cytochrome c oxidase cbb3-type subunit I
VRQIYISNWFMLGSPLFALVLVTIGWAWPLWKGAGQPVVQGWYMHNAVGMWFTPLAVGATYYTLPKLLNKPIYSYALGVLGFWTHLVFYTLIGAHHFILTMLPAWLQTTAVIFSVAMMVPVWASVGNFLLTMRGERSAIRISYSLPFVVVGAIAYGFVSVEGTFLAFPGIQSYEHFTDHTVGHSHMSMIGFVSFFAWGSIYGLLPRVTGKEPSVELVGVHFWLSLVGLLMMFVSLVLGGHLRGRSFVFGEAFIENVRAMAPFWVWRAVGGTFIALGHIVFAWNLWSMRPGAFVDLMRPPKHEEPARPAGVPA